jgi:hypothetical protein
VKYDIVGSFQWGKSIGSISNDNPQDIKIDNNGNIYCVGGVYDTVDFDPGPGVMNLISKGGSDIFIEKLNFNGDFLWAELIGGVGNDQGRAIEISPSDEIYFSGNYSAQVDFDPNAGVYNLNTGSTVSQPKNFILKFKGCYPNTSNDTINSCGPIIWNYSVYYTSGTYVWEGVNVTGCDSTVSLQLTIDSIPDISILQSGNELMSAQSGAIYQWIDCNNDSILINETGQIFNAVNTGYYAVEITNGECIDTSDCYSVLILDVDEMTQLKEKKLIKIIDLLGRETKPISNTPLIFIYDDGTIERVFHMEQ